jgi:hypothetical protein
MIIFLVAVATATSFFRNGTCTNRSTEFRTGAFGMGSLTANSTGVRLFHGILVGEEAV